jgi:hypothetical protein
MLIDCIPYDKIVRRDFFFDRCDSELEEWRLFQIYRTLMVECGVPAVCLHEWRLGGQLYNNMVRAVSARRKVVPLEHLLWLKHSWGVFASRENTSEGLDLMTLTDEEIGGMLVLHVGNAQTGM